MLQTPAFKASGAIFCVTSFVSASPDKTKQNAMNYRTHSFALKVHWSIIGISDFYWRTIICITNSHIRFQVKGINMDNTCISGKDHIKTSNCGSKSLCTIWDSTNPVQTP